MSEFKTTEIAKTILPLLDGVKQTGEQQWIARCPVHDDSRASLSISVGDDGRVLFHCHAGCSTEQIVSKLGLSMASLFPKNPKRRKRKEIVATYHYKNGAQKLRYDDKSFTWRQPDGRGGWQYNRKGLRHTLYIAGKLESPVFVVEGEKDADNVHSLGFNAVCSEDGAKADGKGWYGEYTQQLSGLGEVYIIPDNDDIGREFAQTEAKALHGAVEKVCVLDLRTAWPDIKPKQDISDYLAAFGSSKTIEAINALCRSATPWKETAETEHNNQEDGLRAFQDLLAADNAVNLISRVSDVFKDGREENRAQRLALIRVRAKEIGVSKTIEDLIKTCEREHRRAEESKLLMSVSGADVLGLCYGKNGNPTPTIDNFSLIMSNDPFYENVHFNLLTNNAERDGRRWTDADEAESQMYIEKAYGIFSREKHAAALRLLFKKRQYHPIQQLVNDLEWDGEERCEHFLHEWAKCDDTPYTREVSRLIFAGGIHRLYHPGCKFDDVPVLIGTQGSGKSTLVRWLALNDNYYSEATCISGQRAIEQLAGAWIVEFAELSAIKTEKSAEAVKAYITRQRDKYRMPYDRNVSELPRRCTFIGTTNTAQFLTDQTGGRRFYPVTVRCNGYDLHDHENECRDYIAMCWAEARDKYERGQMPPYADRALTEEYHVAQSAAQEDDWRVGKIQQYLAEKPRGAKVCILQIFREALTMGDDRPQSPSTKESRDIGKIMQSFTDWERCGVRNFDQYGSQKGWLRVRGGIEESDDLPF